MAEPATEGGLRYLASVGDIGSLLDANSTSAVSNWRARHADFPAPVTVGRNPLFDVDDVLAWGRRPDTPGRLRALESMWWWRKALDSIRTEAVIRAPGESRNPVRAFVAAIVVIHAALRGEIDGVRAASSPRWRAIPAAADPAAGLAAEARRLEDAHPRLEGLLVAPLSTVDVRPGALRDLLGRLDAVARDSVAPRERLDAVLHQITPPVHRKLDDSTTDDHLAAVMSAAADVDAGDLVYDPCAGEGGLLLACTRPAGGTVTSFAQELDPESSTVARTRFLLEPLECRVGEPGRDTLSEDQFPDERADVVVCDPPVASRASRSTLDLWLDHVMDHLTDTGRAVIALPSYALSEVPASRRATDERLVGRLRELAAAGHVRDLAILRPDIRGDVPGAMTVWTLTKTPSVASALELRTQRRDGSFDAVSWERPSDEIFAEVGALSPQMSARGQHMRRRRPTAGMAARQRALLDTLIDEVEPLLAKLGRDDAVAIDRVREHLQELRASIEER